MSTQGSAATGVALLLASVLVLGACASAGSAPESGHGAAATRPAGSSGIHVATAGSEAVGSEWPATARPLGDGSSAPARELPGSESTPMQLSQAQSNPAVASLLNTANTQSRAGDHGHAAATLERAISIEPNNAWLWHHLAAARLREGRLDQAASLAAKSNSLAGTDSGLQVNNWKLIAAVRRHQGDGTGAAAAESRGAAGVE